MANYGINGFGRIGRNVLRAMSQERSSASKRSTISPTPIPSRICSNGTRSTENSTAKSATTTRTSSCAATRFRFSRSAIRASLPGKILTCEVVLESTGFFTAATRPKLHITKGGAKKVLISAPAKKSGRDDLHRDQRRNLRSGQSTTSFRTRAAPPIASRRWSKCCNDKFGDRTRLHEHDPQLHQRPAHPRFAARRFAAGARGRGQHHSVEHGRGESDRRSDSGVERETERRRLPRADAGWFGTDFTAILRKRRDRRCDQRGVQRGGRATRVTKACSNTPTSRSCQQDIVGNPHSCIFDSKLTLTLGDKFRESGRLVRQRMGLQQSLRAKCWRCFERK